jgi:adenylylsulfate kinase
MTTVAQKADAFALWITGLPASGKSVVSAELARQFRNRGIQAAVLESDVLRKEFSAHPTYDPQDRENFYGCMAFIGKVLTDHGIAVIFDATANRRAYRDRARTRIPRFLEIYIDSPLEVCIQRDPKGIYRQALSGESQNVPGLQTAYEPPVNPDIVIHGDREKPELAAKRILEMLESRGFIEKKTSP